MVAVASHDHFVYLLDSRSGQILHTCRGHHTPVVHLDFGDGGRVLQTQSADFELLFWNTADGSRCVPGQALPLQEGQSGLLVADALANVQWDGWTCTVGWPVQGIWESSQGESYMIGVCARSGGDGLVGNVEDQLLAVGDESGQVRLFRYPAIGSGCDRESGWVARPPAARAYGRGHCEHVTAVSWMQSAGDRHLLSAGGADATVLQWHVRSHK